MTKRERTREFKRLREVVSDALREADPLGLIDLGAPEDEYDPEVGTILPRLKAVSSLADVRTVLHEEFVRWFDEKLAGAPKAYGGAARKIWGHLQAMGPSNNVRLQRTAYGRAKRRRRSGR